ncbi:uncharacterized protein LOC116297388 [Actinia tenebrosa]|uniref:Uncharacterized protein LOC116297388 n=1 Tax=Actinia tenebrosa TaxID=6105 RepID=A0A6P8I9Y6_ACTTE|nr:uncharacterized protein LOC116297388 [Actinia tenebrosa]
MFISSFLDLFGHSKKKPRSVRAIVREEVDAALRDFYDKTTKNEIDGVVHTITTLKSFVDRISKYKDRMSKSDLNNLKSNVPIFKKTHYLGKLRGQIKAMIKENKPKDARKCLAYLEILLKLETLRDMLFIQLASLSTSTGVSNTYYETVFEKQERIKPLLSFLYDRSKMNYITTYFDSHQYPQTNAYMQLILKMQRPEKFPAPKYCISNGNTVFDWFINQRAHVPLTHPIFGTSFERVCIWRIVSHGHNLFSIVNKYVCSNDPWCNALLSYDGAKRLDKLTVATVEKEDPVLWEIKHLGGHNYRIMPKSFCGKKCGQALGYSRHRILTHYVFAMPILVPQYAYRTVGCLGCPSNIWKIYEPSSDMPSYNESSVKDDNVSKPELVSEEEMNERIGNSSTRGEDGNSTLEKESDEMEENDRSDLGEASN